MNITITTGADGINWQGWATVAVAVSISAWALGSYLVNRHKLRLDLYEKRYKFYLSLHRLLERAINFYSLDDNTKIASLLLRYQIQAVYLFKKPLADEVKAFADELNNQTFWRLAAIASLAQNKKESPECIRNELHFRERANDRLINIRRMIEPYVSFSNVGVEGQLLDTAKRWASTVNGLGTKYKAEYDRQQRSREQ